jgi:hypothetical protein
MNMTSYCYHSINVITFCPAKSDHIKRTTSYNRKKCYQINFYRCFYYRIVIIIKAHIKAKTTYYYRSPPRCGDAGFGSTLISNRLFHSGGAELPYDIIEEVWSWGGTPCKGINRTRIN